MAIKNYTTRISASKTIAEIQEMLVKHGASRIVINYDEEGHAQGVMFSIFNIGSYSLPCRIDGVWELFRKQKLTGATYEQAEKTAWRNVKDWIAAQIALVETEQASFEEVMLPYMISHGRTLYDAMKGQFGLLEEGDAE